VSATGVCVVVDDGCEAPAGYRTGSGIAYGTTRTGKKCFACGEHVCGKCSSKRDYASYGVKRICNRCAEERKLPTPPTPKAG